MDLLGIQDDQESARELQATQEMNEIVEAQNAPKDEPVSEQVDPRTQMFEEFQKLREDRQKAVDDARERDRRTDFYQSVMEAMPGLFAGSAAQRSGVFAQPTKLNLRRTDYAKQAGDDYDRDINNLMQQYRLLSAADRASLKDKRSQDYLDYQKRLMDLKEKQQEQIDSRQQKSFDQRDLDRQIKAEDRVYKVVQDYEKHPVVKELGKQGLSFDQADGLIDQMEQGNQIALGALGTKMARAMGEVGVLTDADVQRYIQAQSLVQKAQDRFGRAFMGRLSDETVKDIKEVTDKMKKGFTRKRKDLYDRYVKRAYENYGKKAGLTLEDVETRFAMPEMKNIQKESDTVLMRAPNGQQQRVKKDMVQKYLDKGATLVEE